MTIAHRCIIVAREIGILFYYSDKNRSIMYYCNASDLFIFRLLKINGHVNFVCAYQSECVEKVQ